MVTGIIAIILLSVIVFACFFVFRILYVRIDELREKYETFRGMYHGLRRLMIIKRNSPDGLSDILSSQYSRIAVYGVGEVGEILINELNPELFDVLYAIDKNADRISLNIPCYKPDDELPEADLVIISVDSAYEEIYKTLRTRFQCRIMLWEDVIPNMK